MSRQSLKVLLLEDSAADAELSLRVLKRSLPDFESRQVVDRAAFLEALENFDPDVVLSDFSLPGFDGLEATRLVKQRKPETPVIIVTGSLGEEKAVQLLKEGAWDYIIKDRLDRLGPAVLRAKAEADALHRQREEQELVNNLLDFTGSLIVVLDATGHFLRVNEGFRRATGYAAEHCIGRSGFDLVVPPEKLVEAQETFQRVIETGSISNYESDLLTKDGGRRTVRWKADVMRNADGLRVVASGLDLTDLREAERQRLQLRSQLAQAERIDSLGRVAATITHEFNNVLMGIQPFADIIARTAGDNERLRMSAEQISRSIQRGTRITREILRFARPSEPTRTPVYAPSWITRMVNGMEMVVGSSMEVVVRSEAERAEIVIDQAQLEQVMINLLVNAKDALAGRENGRVEITMREPAEGYSFGVVPDPSRFLWIEVKDNADGMTEEVRDRLFEPFFTTKQQGTGLGLAVSHQIVTAHGGYMFVKSSPGEGTSFHMFLPRSEE